MKFWKLSHDKTMYDFERMLFYSLKTVFTEILKTRIFKWYYLKFIKNNVERFININKK
jgi:DUF971 family protein